VAAVLPGPSDTPGVPDWVNGVRKEERRMERSTGVPLWTRRMSDAPPVLRKIDRSTSAEAGRPLLLSTMRGLPPAAMAVTFSRCAATGPKADGPLTRMATPPATTTTVSRMTGALLSITRMPSVNVPELHTTTRSISRA